MYYVFKKTYNSNRITSGQISIFGKDISNTEVYRNIGSIIETPGFYKNLSAYQNLRILARYHGDVGESDIKKALTLVGLQDEGKKPFGAFSLGMKQRLGIAAAVMHNPKLLILDEPINGLDPIGIAEIRAFLLNLSRKQGVTILLSSHVLSEIEQLADVIGVMNNGRLVEESDVVKLRSGLKSSYEIRVDNKEAAKRVLTDDFKLSNFKISENNFKIYDTSVSLSDINRCLVENGVAVFELGTSRESLEDYFEKLIGGGGIA